MNKLFSICILFLLTTTVTAQATASTLHRLTNRANAIAEVKVLATQVDRQQLRHVVFKTMRPLRGSPPATFTLREVDGRMCGSILHGLVPGTGLLAFLDHGPAGTRLTLPTPRALVPLHAEVRDHVTALLRPKPARSRVELLTKALAAGHPRVRQDAALALPLLPELAQADGAGRDRILRAMRTTLKADDSSGASLIRAAQRLRLSAALDTLLPHYLGGTQPGLDALLVEAIADIDATGAARRVSRAMPARTSGQQRAVRLLARCGGATAKHCLRELLTANNDSVRVRAAAALLDHGHSADDIRQHAGLEVLDAGRKLLRNSRRPEFRSIRPRPVRPTREH
ncbi:MAG: hypothetical protein ACYTKC_21395 [Planctomycetota bacterium]|jgi:hypothetical protein